MLSRLLEDSYSLVPYGGCINSAGDISCALEPSQCPDGTFVPPHDLTESLDCTPSPEAYSGCYLQGEGEEETFGVFRPSDCPNNDKWTSVPDPNASVGKPMECINVMTGACQYGENEYVCAVSAEACGENASFVPVLDLWDIMTCYLCDHDELKSAKDAENKVENDGDNQLGNGADADTHEGDQVTYGACYYEEEGVEESFGVIDRSECPQNENWVFVEAANTKEVLGLVLGCKHVSTGACRVNNEYVCAPTAAACGESAEFVSVIGLFDVKDQECFLCDADDGKSKSSVAQPTDAGVDPDSLYPACYLKDEGVDEAFGVMDASDCPQSEEWVFVETENTEKELGQVFGCKHVSTGACRGTNSQYVCAASASDCDESTVFVTAVDLFEVHKDLSCFLCPDDADKKEHGDSSTPIVEPVSTNAGQDSGNSDHQYPACYMKDEGVEEAFGVIDSSHCPKNDEWVFVEAANTQVELGHVFECKHVSIGACRTNEEYVCASSASDCDDSAVFVNTADLFEVKSDKACFLCPDDGGKTESGNTQSPDVPSTPIMDPDHHYPACYMKDEGVKEAFGVIDSSHCPQNDEWVFVDAEKTEQELGHLFECKHVSTGACRNHNDEYVCVASATDCDESAFYVTTADLFDTDQLCFLCEDDTDQQDTIDDDSAFTDDQMTDTRDSGNSFHPIQANDDQVIDREVASKSGAVVGILLAVLIASALFVRSRRSKKQDIKYSPVPNAHKLDIEVV